jgi:hypothetical protein
VVEQLGVVQPPAGVVEEPQPGVVDPGAVGCGQAPLAGVAEGQEAVGRQVERREVRAGAGLRGPVGLVEGEVEQLERRLDGDAGEVGQRGRTR